MLNFVKLIKLTELKYADETQEQTQRWLTNLKVSGVEAAWTLDEDGGEFSADEMQLVEGVEVYDFMGSQYEEERFYIKDVDVFKHKVSGEYYVVERDSLWEF